MANTDNKEKIAKAAAKAKALKLKEKEKVAKTKAKEKATKEKAKAKEKVAKEKAKAKAAKEKEKAKTKSTRVARPKSTSGKYTSIRHLMETLFAKDAKLTFEKALPILKKEFPSSKMVTKEDKPHFGWYKHHIIGLKEIKTR